MSDSRFSYLSMFSHYVACKDQNSYFLSSFWIWSYFFVAIYRHDLWSWRSHKGHFGRKSWSSSSLSWQRPSCLHQCWGTCKILWVKLCFKTLELNFLHRKKWYTQVSDFFLQPISYLNIGLFNVNAKKLEHDKKISPRIKPELSS